MDFIDEIKALAATIATQLDRIKTEEATKSALVMPFIQKLGYNVFDINEVVPEYDANVGASKKYKLDYAILQDGKPIILIECKHHTDILGEDVHSQLFHYFAATEARIGVLTNGLIYRFYSDLDESNKLDKKPFLEIDLLNLQENSVAELKKLSKSNFDLDLLLSAASELKYTREIIKLLSDELQSPSDDFVKFFASRVYSGRVTERVRQEFSGFVKRGFKQFIREQISDLLQSASNLADSTDTQAEPTELEEPELETVKNQVETTEEELEGFYIVKSILSEIIDPSRIAYKDTRSYFNILLENNTWKPICRLYFNNLKNKRIELFDHSEGDRQSEKFDLENIHDLYKYGDRLKATVRHYETKP